MVRDLQNFFGLPFSPVITQQLFPSQICGSSIRWTKAFETPIRSTSSFKSSEVTLSLPVGLPLSFSKFRKLQVDEVTLKRDGYQEAKVKE
jgi:hypothetical protein